MGCGLLGWPSILQGIQPAQCQTHGCLHLSQPRQLLPHIPPRLNSSPPSAQVPPRLVERELSCLAENIGFPEYHQSIASEIGSLRLDFADERSQVLVGYSARTLLHLT